MYDIGQFQAVPFAVDAGGVFRGVNEVESGLACGCFCAECGTRVVARKGAVRVHHFAHKDRRDCWNVLEAALWGMTARILAEPGAKLAVPPAGAYQAEFMNVREVVEPSQVEEFRQRDWIISPAVLELHAVEVRAAHLRDAVEGRADIAAEELYLCFLHGRRPSVQIPQGVLRPVLTLDLRVYARKWIDLCEEREASMQDAMFAVDRLRQWLAAERTGRVWQCHPGVAAEVRRIKSEAEGGREARAEAWRRHDEMIAERNRIEAERSRRDAERRQAAERQRQIEREEERARALEALTRPEPIPELPPMSPEMAARMELLYGDKFQREFAAAKALNASRKARGAW